MTRRSRPAYLSVAVAVVWLALGLPAVVTTASAQSGDVLYGALVLATNSEHPDPPPEALRSHVENLKKVFGYNEFHLLGEKRKAVPTGKEDWLVPSRQFFLRVDTRNPVVGGYALSLQLVQDDQVLVEADVKVKRDRPLFIRGPFVGDGQLLILLTVL